MVKDIAAKPADRLKYPGELVRPPEIHPLEPHLSDMDWPPGPGSWLPDTDGWPLTGD